jgi:biotin-(acetyl-CoA carboxylase) ligase
MAAGPFYNPYRDCCISENQETDMLEQLAVEKMRADVVAKLAKADEKAHRRLEAEALKNLREQQKQQTATSSSAVNVETDSERDEVTELIVSCF